MWTSRRKERRRRILPSYLVSFTVMPWAAQRANSKTVLKKKRSKYGKEARIANTLSLRPDFHLLVNTLKDSPDLFKRTG